MNEQMTFTEFKAWFNGFLAGKDGVTLQPCDIEQIKTMLDSVVEEEKQPTVIINPVPVPITYFQPIVLPTAPVPPMPWITNPIWCGDDTTGGTPPGVVKKYLTTTVSSGTASNQLSNGQCFDALPLH